MKNASQLSTRELPFIDDGLPEPTRPISFVCVRFSDEFHHNIEMSECVNNSFNEFIVIDNTLNLHYQTLGQAMNAGISQARHDLIVVVHEDVLLLPGWQALFESSLRRLEKEVPNWLVLGVVGWTGSTILGSCSDPSGLHNAKWRGVYEEVAHIDEQLLVFKRNSGLIPDSNLPTIHNHSRDLIQSAKAMGQKCYVLRAPTVHKYADDTGKPTLKRSDSKKILNRQNTIYKLHKQCSNEYIAMKWPKHYGNFMVDNRIDSLDENQLCILSSPLILVGEQLTLEAAINQFSEDEKKAVAYEKPKMDDAKINLSASVVKAIFRKYQCPFPDQKKHSSAEIKFTAANFLHHINWPERWIIAIEESAFIIDELQGIFANCTVLTLDNERTTETSYDQEYIENELGRTLLAAAYTSMQSHSEHLVKEVISNKSEHLSAFLDKTIAQCALKFAAPSNSTETIKHWLNSSR